MSIGGPPDTYLGLPVTTKEVSNNFWNTITERIQKKLAGWKGKILSSVGKFQSLSMTLQFIPIYFLSLFKINQVMAKKIEKIQRKFYGQGQRRRTN